jgi:hypothetical protein
MRTMHEVLSALRGFRLPSSTEEELQEAIAQVLTRAGVMFTREHRFGPPDRIDFYLPALNAGLEVKTQGSPNAVLRQLFRYAEHDDVLELALVTTRLRLGGMPREIRGVPLQVLVLWEGAL